MGQKYMLDRYSGKLKKLAVSRLGTRDYGIGPYFPESKIRIISCSNLIPLKQTRLIALSLFHLKLPVEWHHIGDGPLMNSLKDITSKLGPDGHVKFHGHLDHNALFKIYQQQVFDIFINCSTSEGVPVSIMEALSFGIPVIATDVGGTNEIVDAFVGVLISPTITPEELAVKITELLDRNDYLILRQNARERWLERCQNETLFSRFVDLVTN
jgi:glycosyltransferase involved in cell wall biosynthesis